MDYAVALFFSIHGAMAAERLLIEHRIDHKLVAVPRHISSHCGFCLRFSAHQIDEVEPLLRTHNFGLDRVVPLACAVVEPNR